MWTYFDVKLKLEACFSYGFEFHCLVIAQYLLKNQTFVYFFGFYADLISCSPVLASCTNVMEVECWFLCIVG